MSDSSFYIVRSRGSLHVVEILAALYYELSDYDVASQRSFSSRSEAEEVAAQMADRHGLGFRGEGSSGYLD